MLGSHWLKSWSATQKIIALSSGEAELVAIVKMSTELIGMMSMYLDFDRHLGARVFADSNAALGVVQRKGAGKLRHIRVQTLWVQDARESGQLEYKKVGGLANPGDLMTKHLSRKMMTDHLRALAIDLREGRAEAGLKIDALTKRELRGTWSKPVDWERPA